MCASCTRAVTACGTFRWMSASWPGRAAVAPRERDGRHPTLGCGLQALDDVGRVAAGRDAEGDVARRAKRLDLPREDALEPVVVGHRRHQARVGRQCQRRHRASFPLIPAHELGHEVLGVGGTAAVAEDEQRLAVAKRLGDGVDRARERLQIAAPHRRQQVDRLAKNPIDRSPSPFVHVDAYDRRRRRSASTLARNSSSVSCNGRYVFTGSFTCTG